MRELYIVGRTAAVVLAGALSACVANGVTVPSPAFLAVPISPDAPKNVSATLDAPNDVASLPDEPKDIFDPFERMNRSVFERNERFNHAVVYPVAKAYRNNVPGAGARFG